MEGFEEITFEEAIAVLGGEPSDDAAEELGIDGALAVIGDGE